MKYLLSLAVLILGSALALAQGPTYTSYEVPAGYTGPLILILKEGEGMKVPASTTPVTFTFPEDGDGVLVVEKASYLRNQAGFEKGEIPPGYAGPRAHYSGGEHLPMEGMVEDSAPAFRTVYTAEAGQEKGATSMGAIYYYIGTLAEAREFEKKNKAQQAAEK